MLEHYPIAIRDIIYYDIININEAYNHILELVKDGSPIFIPIDDKYQLTINNLEELSTIKNELHKIYRLDKIKKLIHKK